MPLLHVSDCFTNNNNNDPDFGEFTGTKDLDGLGIPLSNQVRIGMYNANDVVTGGVTLFQICAYEGTDKGRDTRCSSNDAYAIRHPRWNPKTLDYDYTLIVLPRKVTSIAPVILNTDKDTPAELNDPLVAAGWGYTQPSGPEASLTPNKLDLKYALCPLIAGYGPSELCAQPPSDATLCSGDSGTIYTYTTCIV